MITRCRRCSSLFHYIDSLDRPHFCHACKLPDEHGPTDKPAKPPKRRNTRKAK